MPEAHRKGSMPFQGENLRITTKKLELERRLIQGWVGESGQMEIIKYTTITTNYCQDVVLIVPKPMRDKIQGRYRGEGKMG